MTEYLHGIHDEGGEHLHADKPGWTVITEAIGSDPNDRNGRDYRHLTSRGFTPIVRLNNGYHPGGTIPRVTHYADFAKRCANFVAVSQGLTHVIIGNETNHLQERPDGIVITPAMYADCFAQCFDAIKSIAPRAQVITAPVAPWDASTAYIENPSGDWVQYFADMLEMIPACDGIGLHAYTHGAGIHLITSSARMQPPFQHRRYEFRAYRDFLEAVPTNKRNLPTYITETDQVDPWVNANTQWVQAAYAEIDAWNQLQGTQKIHCLVLYRWQGDQWEVATKQGVHADFRAAVARGYGLPQFPGKGQESVQTYLPSVSPGTVAVPDSLPPRNISEDFKQRVDSISRADPEPGENYYALTEAVYLPPPQGAQRFGPDHHILVDVIGLDGKRKMGETVNFFNLEGKQPKKIDKANDPYGVDCPMFQVGHAWGVWVGSKPENSDAVWGMGLGTIEDMQHAHHVTYFLRFEERMPAAATPPIEAPQPVEPKETPVATGIIDPRVAQAILQIESGGRTHGENGKPLIRFEAHIFKTYLDNDALWANHFRTDPNKPWVNQEWRPTVNDAWRPIHTGKQADEYAAFEFAKVLIGPVADPHRWDVAHKSISMGAPQIMGFNYARIGYSNAQDMFESFASAPMQTLGFINFCLSDPKLMDAIARKDWRTIAKLYNGAGAVDTYAPLLEKAYNELGG